MWGPAFCLRLTAHGYASLSLSGAFFCLRHARLLPLGSLQPWCSACHAQNSSFDVVDPFRQVQPLVRGEGRALGLTFRILRRFPGSTKVDVDTPVAVDHADCLRVEQRKFWDKTNTLMWAISFSSFDRKECKRKSGEKKNWSSVAGASHLVSWLLYMVS